MDDFEIVSRFLAYLARTLDRPDVGYADGPTRITGGFDAAIFGFALKDAPPALSGPLVLRINRPGTSQDRVRLEAAVHNWLAEHDYPVPFVHAVELDATVLGGPFMVMTRIVGRPLAHEIEGIGRGSFLTQVMMLMRAPALLRRVTDTWVDAQIRLHALDAQAFLQAIVGQGIQPGLVNFEGHLSWLASMVRQFALDGLKPGLDWLATHRPSPSLRPAICHCDFHPLNILGVGGAMTGVIDWGNVVIAPAEMDVGSAIANVGAVPFPVPNILQFPLRLVVGSILRRYRLAYQARHPLDDAAVRYFQVYRGISQLVVVARTRLTGEGGGAFNSAAGVRNIVRQVRKLSGVNLSLDLPKH